MIISKPLVDRKSPMPAYQQIASHINERITHEEWLIGDRLPSETDLAAQYNVSRITLRQALSILEADGIICRYQGKGAFVQANPNIFWQDLRLPTVSNHGKAFHNSKVFSESIHIRKEAAAPRISYINLQVPENTPLLFLQRFFVKDNRKLGLNQVWFPAELVPSLEDLGLVQNSISTTLKERYDLSISKIDSNIEALKLNASFAQMLNVNTDDAALKIDSIHYLDNGLPIEYSSTVWVGEYTRFHVEATQ